MSPADTGQKPSGLLEWAPLLLLAVVATKWIVAGVVLGSGTPPRRVPVLTTIALFMACAGALVWIRGPWRMRLVILLDGLSSLLVLIDLWYQRFYGQLPALSSIWQLGNLRFVTGSIVHQMQWVDVLVVADLPLLAVIARRVRATSRLASAGATAVLIAVSLVLLAPASLVLFRDPDGVITGRFQRSEVVGALGLPAYHLVDATSQWAAAIRRRVGSADDHRARAEQMIRDRRETEFDSLLAGSARGANVILISAESLQGFVVHANIDGHSLTPNLDAFAGESLSFSEFYDQTYLGSTADAEFMVMASGLPLDNGVVATRFSSNRFVALPEMLREAGYRTLSATGEPPGFWNMREMHPALGFASSRFAPDFARGEWVGVGIDDVSFLQETAASIRQLPEPFMAYLITSTNHHPYQLPHRLRESWLTTGAGTMAGDYLQTVHYFDKAFGTFIDGLRRSGLLDRSVVVVYGDHQSWLSDDDLMRLHRVLRTNTPSPADLWRFRHRIPLLIRLPHGAHAGERPVPGGLVDVAPTLFTLLGRSVHTVPWLGHDLTGAATRLVVFRDGSFTDGLFFRIQDAGKTPQCSARAGPVFDCALLSARQRDAVALLSASDSIVERDLAEPIARRLHDAPSVSRGRSGRLMVIAHRGLSQEFPENTVEAIAAAETAGADAVEIDVHISRDGVPFVFHDDALERTSNGHGPVALKTIAELKSLDAGRWLHPRFTGLRIPSLLEVLNATKGRIPLLLDLKMDGMGAAIARVYAAAGVAQDRAWIGGWTHRQREDFALNMPAARILRTEPAPAVWGRELDAQLRRERVWGFELGDDWPPAFVADARRKGFPVIVYTINDEATMRRVVESGVSGIETDDPRRLLRVALEMGAR